MSELRLTDYQKALNILEHITYKNWNLHVKQDISRNGCVYIQWHFTLPCAKTGMEYMGAGRKWYLSPYMTESELVQTALKAALTAEEHEAREAFLYHGKRIFGPHISVRALMEVCDQEDLRT
jgi:hypothetical protein